jgi:galactose oxidase
MIRTGCMSHSLNTDVRLVVPAFKKAGSKLTIYPPKLPGTAVGGYWMLFIVDENGVPSTAAKFQLGRDIEKRVGKPASKFVSN